MAGKGSWLTTGQYLAVGDYLVSASGQYFAIMQGDANLVIYQGSDPDHRLGFVWNSGSGRTQASYFAIMQNDGNLCIYQGAGPSQQGGFIWNSGIFPGQGLCFVILQDDGTLAVYQGTDPAHQGALAWRSGPPVRTDDGSTVLSVSYSVSPDPTLPASTFRFSVTTPPADQRLFTCNLVSSAGTAVAVVTAKSGTASSAPEPFGSFPGNSISAHLNVQGSNAPDRVIPLVFDTPVSAALNQQCVSFTWASQPVAAGGGTRPLAELDPNGSPVVLSYDVPEPTSYRGRQVIQLDIPLSYFATQAQGGGQLTPHAVPTQPSQPGQPGQPPAQPGSPLTTSVGSGPVIDSSLVYSEDVPLLGSTPPAGRVAAAQLSDSRITAAFNTAKTTGYCDPSVFPNVQAGNDEYTRAFVMKALAALDAPTVVTQLTAGNRLTIYRDISGRCTYRFIPAPQSGVPTLLLVEYYRLSSFPARYGAGRTIKTFSLLPGERTRIRVSTYKRTTETTTRSSSILDSTTDETESEFERSIAGEQTRQDNTSRAFEYHAEAQAEAKASWGWGSASVTASGGVKGTSNVAREEFAKNVATAVAQNAARASSRRDVQIDTSLDRKLEVGEEQAIERELENVNVSRTLNFVFRQMNQEFVTLLHLVDVRVAFFNGFAESRAEVSLPELDQLLRTYILPQYQQQVQAAIMGELQGIVDYTGTVRPEFVENVTLTGAGGASMSYLRVNPDASSAYGSGVAGPFINVPGVIMSADTHVMRTDGVVVDTFLGLGNGLDDYSMGLQEEEVRGRRIENDRRQAEVDRIRLAISLVQSRDTVGVDLYQRAFPLPQIVNQIEQAAISNSPNGSAAPAPAP